MSLTFMTGYNFISPDLLKSAYFSGLRPEEICWKTKDIKKGIREFIEHGKEIGAITIYFKVGDKVYCPVWGDCLMLEGGNDEYLKLFNGIDLTKTVDY